MNVWAIFVAFILLLIWWIYSTRPQITQFPIAIERQAKILAGLAAGILGYELISESVIPLAGIIISSILVIAVWILVFYDKFSNSVGKWLVKLCLSIDAGYSALALSFGALANNIPLTNQGFAWIRLGFYACCYVFLVITIIRLVIDMRNRNVH